MPEYLIGTILAALLAAGTGIVGKVFALDGRIDKLEVKIAENYVTKADLLRFEDKLDAILMASSKVIASRTTQDDQPGIVGPFTNKNYHD